MHTQKLHVVRGFWAFILKSTAAAAVAWLLLSGPAVADFDDDEIPTEVECYRADPSGYDHEFLDMGHVSVDSGQQPAAACNAVNYSCRGQCFACVFDYDYSADVCVDTAGNRFLK